MAAPLLMLASACSTREDSAVDSVDASATRTFWVSAPLIVYRDPSGTGPKERKFSGRCRVTPRLDGKPVAWLNAAPGSSVNSTWWESGAGQPISVLTGELRYLADCLEAAGVPIHRASPPVADASFSVDGAADPAAFSLHVELEATEELVGGTSPYRSAQVDFSSAQFPPFDDAKSPGRMNTVEVECRSAGGNGSLVLTLRLWQTAGR